MFPAGPFSPSLPRVLVERAGVHAEDEARVDEGEEEVEHEAHEEELPHLEHRWEISLKMIMIFDLL